MAVVDVGLPHPLHAVSELLSDPLHGAVLSPVLRWDAWGRGLGTEVAVAMTGLADGLELNRLYALCHPDNIASAHVLAKANFIREGVLRRHTYFPNMAVDGPQDVEIWARVTC